MATLVEVLCRELRQGRKILIDSPYSTASMALAAEIGCRCAEKACIAVSHGSEQLAALLRCGHVYIADSVYGLEACEGLKILLLFTTPHQVKELLERVDVIAAPRIRRGSAWGQGVVYVRVRRRGAIYVAELLNRTYMFVVRGGEVSDYRLSPELEKALRALEEATLSYGTLSVRDAVTVVSSALGLSKSEARRVLAALRELGVVRIEGGVVTPLA